MSTIAIERKSPYAQKLLTKKEQQSPFLKSGTIISHGKQFLKEHWQKQPTLFRMSSNPSNAHLSAVSLVEKQSAQNMETQLKKVLESIPVAPTETYPKKVSTDCD